MAISIADAKTIGDKKMRFGRGTEGPSLRGELKTILIAAAEKDKAISAEEAAKKVGATLNQEVNAEFIKKVATGLEDLKYAGHAARAVDEKGNKFYYFVQKEEAKTE